MMTQHLASFEPPSGDHHKGELSAFFLSVFLHLVFVSLLLWQALGAHVPAQENHYYRVEIIPTVTEQETQPLPTEATSALAKQEPSKPTAVSSPTPSPDKTHVNVKHIVAAARTPSTAQPLKAAPKQLPTTGSNMTASSLGHSVSMQTTEAKAVLDQPQPIYPGIARRMRQEGKVLVSLYVDSEGRVLSAKVQQSSGFSSLDESAITTLTHWRFSPALSGGVAVPSVVNVPINFHLSG